MATSFVNPNNGPRPGGAPQPQQAVPPPSAPSFASIFGGQSPWQPSVTAGINGQPTNFASPGQPNSNYVTSTAAQQLAKLFGANAVQQNRTGMASPGSPAPSQPLYGLDFGRGDVQGADVAATGLQRGDSVDQIAGRYQAGLNTQAWAGPHRAPQMAPNADIFWDRSTPVSTNTPSAAQSQFFAPQAPANVPGSSTPGVDAYGAQLMQMLSGGQSPWARYFGAGSPGY